MRLPVLGPTPNRPFAPRGALTLLGALAAVLSHAAPASAFPVFRSRFFSAYPEAVGTELDSLPSNANHCGVCHYNFNGGGPRNEYGLAVQATDRSVAAIAADLDTRLARYKQPKALITVEALPRNTMGKVLKSQLRESYRDWFA